MITCTRTANGGRIIVDETHGHSVVEFWLSDTTPTPLSLRIQESLGSTARLTLSVANSLAERYGSPVVWLETANAELRYTATLGNGLRRNATHGNGSLYTKPFDNSKLFGRIHSLAEAMSAYSFVRSESEQLQFFDHYMVLATVRKKTKPMEFLSIKEECDCLTQSACVDTVREMITAGKAQLDHTGEYRSAFFEILDRLDRSQDAGAQIFDSKRSYIKELAAEVCLPAIVLFGTTNTFVKHITEAFLSGAAKYITTTQELLETYDAAFKYSK